MTAFLCLVVVVWLTIVIGLMDDSMRRLQRDYVAHLAAHRDHLDHYHPNPVRIAAAPIDRIAGAPERMEAAPR